MILFNNTISTQTYQLSLKYSDTTSHISILPNLSPTVLNLVIFSLISTYPFLLIYPTPRQISKLSFSPSQLPFANPSYKRHNLQALFNLKPRFRSWIGKWLVIRGKQLGNLMRSRLWWNWIEKRWKIRTCLRVEVWSRNISSEPPWCIRNCLLPPLRIIITSNYLLK